MTEYETFVCSEFKAGRMTEAKISFLKLTHKISQECYDCAHNPDCTCALPTSMAATAEAPTE